MKQHLAHTLVSSFRTLLFFLAAGIFIFSCNEDIKLSSEASITSFTLMVGDTDYEITFTDKKSTITVPYATVLSTGAVVKTVTLSAKAKGVKVGETLTIPASGILTLTVTAEDNKTKGVYTVTVKKAAASKEATMTSLTLTVADRDYPVTFTNNEGTITVPYGTVLSAGAVVKTVELSAGATGVKVDDTVTISDSGTLTLTVTAEDGKTTQEYTVTLSVDANNDAGITSLKLSIAGSDYDVTFTDTQGSVALSYGTVIPALVGVSTLEVSPGATSDAGTELTVTDNAVTITVTAADGTTEKTYTVTLVVDANDEALITSLKLSIGGSDYDVTFTDTQGSVALSYGTVIPALVGVSTLEVSPGATSDAGTELTVTNNAVTITVTAADGTTEKMYTVTLVVDANDEALITSLKLSIGGSDYDVTFTDTQGSVALSYGTVIPALVGVSTLEVSPGATSDAGTDLTVTNNAVTITVTAEDGTTEKTYTVTLVVDANDEASITSLKLSIGGSDYDVTFTDTQGSVALSPGTVIPARVSVASVQLSDGATGVVQGNDLTVTDNTITITVTAEDATTTQEYTVRLIVSVGITSFTFEVIDNENMALDEDDRKRIVGIINQQASTITFAQQSAYVSRDKLKATFALSEAGAGVQVEGVTQTSGVTEQDFTSPVSYVVSAPDGREATYTVTLTKSTLATIEDDNFRTRLSTLFPDAFTGDQLDITHENVLNNNGTLTVNRRNLTSLKGIEFFTALTALDCSNNSLTSLDISKNTALTSLTCTLNDLTSLDVSENTALMSLYCGNNAIASLDVSKNTALTNLACYDNALTSLDVSANTALVSLVCDFNKFLTSLDMTGMRSVTNLNIGSGTGDNNALLETLRVNTALQDRPTIVNMKTARGEALTITTVNNEGDVVCNDYAPANPGTCNDAP